MGFLTASVTTGEVRSSLSKGKQTQKFYVQSCLNQRRQIRKNQISLHTKENLIQLIALCTEQNALILVMQMVE